MSTQAQPLSGAHNPAAFSMPATKALAMYSGEDALKKLQDRDAEKRLACSAMEIALIEVPYWWDHSKAKLEKMIEAGPGAATPPS